MALTLNQKIEMTESLWDSIYHEAQHLPMTDEQARLLEQRLAVYTADSQAGRCWDEVVACLNMQRSSSA